MRGISSDCGFLIQYQAAVQAAVRVPVFMSSMLQIPFLAQAIGGRAVGRLTANGEQLTEQVLGLAGVAPGTRVVIRGMETQPHFKEAILEECGFLDSDRLQEECVRAARQLQGDEPDVGALVLECSLMPPFARAIQEAAGLPTFDFVTMIDYYYAGRTARRTTGTTDRVDDIVATFEVRRRRFLDPDGTPLGELPAFADRAGELMAMYRAMIRARAFDARCTNLQRTGRTIREMRS